MVTRTVLVLALLLSGFDRLAAQDPAALDSRLELRRIEAMERSGQLSEAAMALEDMLRRTPAQVGAVLAYERVCRRLGQLDRVIPVVSRAIDRDPDSPLLRQVQLRVLSELGDLQGLRTAGRRWLETAPGSDAAYRDYAKALQRLGARAEAEAVLRQGARQTDRPIAMAVELANLYEDERRWSKSAQQWVRVMRSSPDLGWDLVNFKLRTLGDEAAAAAEALLRQLASDPSGGVQERALAAIAALYAGAAEEAQRRAESLLEELEPRQWRAFVDDFARVAANRSQPGLVAWAYRQLLREAPGDSTRWELARQIVENDLSAGDTAAALQLLGELTHDSEIGTPAHEWSARLQLRLLAARGDLEGAKRALESYETRYGQRREFASLALLVAEQNIRRGRLADARAILTPIRADEMGPSTLARLSASRGFLAFYAGHYEEARSELEVAAALMVGEGRGEVLRVLGFLRAANGSELEAASAAHRAAAQGRRREALQALLDGMEGVAASAARPALLLWAGRLAIDADEFETAESVLGRIPRTYPDSGEAPVALLRLAEALAAADRQPEAIALLETLILEYPASALAPLGRRRLAELKQEVPRS